MGVDTIILLIVMEDARALPIRVDWIAQMGWLVEMDLKIVLEEKEEKTQT